MLEQVLCEVKHRNNSFTGGFHPPCVTNPFQPIIYHLLPSTISSFLKVLPLLHSCKKEEPMGHLNQEDVSFIRMGPVLYSIHIHGNIKYEILTYILYIQLNSILYQFYFDCPFAKRPLVAYSSAQPECGPVAKPDWSMPVQWP